MARYKVTVIRRFDTINGDYDPYTDAGGQEDCGYTVISNHECVVTSDIANVGNSDLESDNRKELAKKTRGFIIKLTGASDIQYGDYIAYTKTIGATTYMYIYKIISIAESELINGCCKLFITGENLQSRECSGIARVCGETDYVLG